MNTVGNPVNGPSRKLTNKKYLDASKVEGSITITEQDAKDILDKWMKEFENQSDEYKKKLGTEPSLDKQTEGLAFSSRGFTFILENTQMPLWVLFWLVTPS